MMAMAVIVAVDVGRMDEELRHRKVKTRTKMRSGGGGATRPGRRRGRRTRLAPSASDRRLPGRQSWVSVDQGACLVVHFASVVVVKNYFRLGRLRDLDEWKRDVGPIRHR